MSAERKARLSINGMGTVDGGMYQEVKIAGQGAINEDLDAIKLSVNGHLEGMGNVIAETMSVNGRLVVNKNLSAKQSQINGQVKVLGDLDVHQLRIHGEVVGMKSLASEGIELYGSLKLDGNCNAETFRGKSHFQIQGLLNADEINVTLYSNCSAKEIGGEKIIIKGNESKWNKLFSWFQSDLQAECIEGDYIELENTHAKVVRGKQIKIGKNCKIDRIEYEENFSAHTDSKIGESVQI